MAGLVSIINVNVSHHQKNKIHFFFELLFLYSFLCSVLSSLFFPSLITTVDSVSITSHWWGAGPFPLMKIYKLLSSVEVNWGAVRDQCAATSVVTPGRRGRVRHTWSLACSRAVNTDSHGDNAAFLHERFRPFHWRRVICNEWKEKEEAADLQQQTYSLWAWSIFNIKFNIQCVFPAKSLVIKFRESSKICCI